jgi:benzoylformate decarboxylase
VQGTVDPLHPNFRGQLPPTTKEINEILSRYHTMLLVGEKVDTFTYDGCSATPGELQVIQIAPATSQLGFDYPCDVAVLGEIKATLSAIGLNLEPPRLRLCKSARLMWRRSRQNIRRPGNVLAMP